MQSACRDAPTIPDKKEDDETNDNNTKCADNADDNTNNGTRHWNTGRYQHAKHFIKSTVSML